jgi:transposase-like protein
VKHFESLIDLLQAFPNEKACAKHLRAIRWQHGAYCPHCHHDKVYEFAKRPIFKCAKCRVNFSIRVGTIFEDSKLPLRTWFAAIWLITNHPKGIASTTLAKDLKVTQKTAWFMLHRLRHATRVRAFDKPLSGIVEIDITFIKGGTSKARHANNPYL